MDLQNVYYIIENDFHNLHDCYFCESCNKIVAQDCVRLEADTYFCPGCLDNIPTSEAFLNNFCCKKCYNCFRCNATISLTNAFVNKKSIEGESLEHGQLSCEYCGYLYTYKALDFGNSLSIIKNSDDSYISNIDGYCVDLSAEVINYIDIVVESLNKAIELSLQTKVKSSSVQSSKLTKNVWLDRDKIRLLCDTKVIITSAKNDLDITLTQYLKNPQIINSYYICPKYELSSHLTKLPLIEKELYAQFSKRCSCCKRLVIKSQLNPIAQPPFRINLSANLFMPNFKIISVERDILYRDRSYNVLIKLRIENLMDRVVKVDFLSLSDCLENAKYQGDSEIVIEPMNLTIEPKWIPTSENIQNQHSQEIVREKIGRNKRQVNVYIRNLLVINNGLNLSGISSFKSPTGNDSAIKFTIFLNW